MIALAARWAQHAVTEHLQEDVVRQQLCKAYALARKEREGSSCYCSCVWEKS